VLAELRAKIAHIPEGVKKLIQGTYFEEKEHYKQEAKSKTSPLLAYFTESRTRLINPSKSKEEKQGGKSLEKPGVIELS